MQSVSPEENHEQSLQPGPSNVDAIQPSASKRASKKYTSPIWNYFEKVQDQPNFASCLICGLKYQHSSNTSNLAKVSKEYDSFIHYAAIFYPLFMQHLKTKHLKEWQACEEEKKEVELIKKRKLERDDATMTQPTLSEVINKKSVYPSMTCVQYII